ncbi:MAG: type II toxin-antitoxin system RelE family toxin [Terriglobia bacterium]
MFKVSITSSAERALKRLDRPIKNRVVSAILTLATDPRPPGCLKVKSEEGVWRIRVGDWRVGYLVDDDAGEVSVIKIAHRSEFYG